jgi:hypothetical protein
MSFDLSFSEDFFYPVAARDPDEPEHPERPTSLYEAIAVLKNVNPIDFREACREARVNPSASDAVMALLEYARHDVDACADLSSPVEVYLTKDFYVSVEVYEHTEAHSSASTPPGERLSKP